MDPIHGETPRGPLCRSAIYNLHFAIGRNLHNLHNIAIFLTRSWGKKLPLRGFIFILAILDRKHPQPLIAKQLPGSHTLLAAFFLANEPRSDVLHSTKKGGTQRFFMSLIFCVQFFVATKIRVSFPPGCQVL